MFNKKIVLIVAFLFVLICDLSKFGHLMSAEAVDISDEAKLSNDYLKKTLAVELIDKSLVRKALAEHNYKILEIMYDDIFCKYQKNIDYEYALLDAYEIFSQSNGIMVEDLDKWVESSGSYISYAARGHHKAESGYEARGTEYINETPPERLKNMHFFLNQAEKDIYTALDKNTKLIIAYKTLLDIEKTSSPDKTRMNEIINKALQSDNRSFYVRHSYMMSLQPRWGGSYEEMSKFAQECIKYNNLNPRIWSLQGEKYADVATLYHSKGDFKSAINFYTKALEFGDRVTLLKYRANCYLELGMNNEAEQDYRKILYYSPQERSALNFFKNKNKP